MVLIADDLQRIIADIRTDQFTSRKAVLVFVIVIFALSVIVLALAVSLGISSRSVSHCNWLYGGDRCATPDCLRTAAWIADSLDLDVSSSVNTSAARVDPCDNFYQFACGAWELRHSIPPGDSEVTLIDQLENDIEDRLRRLIDRGPSPRSRSTALSPASQSALKLGYFYNSCMHDMGRMTNAGKELVELIRAVVGQWYVFDPTGWTDGESASRQWDFQDAIVSALQYTNIFHDTWIDKDRVTGGSILLMTHVDLGLQTYLHYIKEDKIGVREAYKDYMRQVASLLLRDANITLDPTQTRSRIEQFVSDVYGQEEHLALILQQLQTGGLLYARMRTTIGAMENDYPQLNWLRFLQGLFSDPSLDVDRPILLQSPLYFRLVDDLLRNESDSHVRKRIINNYIVWRLALQFAPELSSDYREAGARYRQAAYGVSYLPTTWQMCVDAAKSRLGSLVAWLYVKAHLAPDVKGQVSTLFNNIRSVVTQRIGELSWMDDTTKSRAIEKIDTLEVVIGFADIYYNDTLMEQMHASLAIDQTQSYLKNVLAINRWQRQQHIRIFIVDPPVSWHQHMPLIGWSSLWAVRPFYNYYTHSLVVPAGALSDPLYETTRPDVFNYAILGANIADTLLSSVGEDLGRYTWTNGSWTSWWTNASGVEFQKTKQCFESFFDGLSVGPLLINGENISVAVDARSQTYKTVSKHGAIRIGLKAYQSRKKNMRDPLPIGLNVSPEQLYFISIAQKYCYLRTDEARYNNALKNFVPEDFELNSLLAHMPEFTDAFKCPAGSKLRNSYQCEVY